MGEGGVEGERNWWERGGGKNGWREGESGWRKGESGWRRVEVSERVK